MIYIFTEYEFLWYIHKLTEKQSQLLFYFHSYRDFYQWFDPALGNCFTFNSGWNSSDTSELRTSHITGPLYGKPLKITMEACYYDFQPCSFMFLSTFSNLFLPLFSKIINIIKNLILFLHQSKIIFHLLF